MTHGAGKLPFKRRLVWSETDFSKIEFCLSRGLHVSVLVSQKRDLLVISSASRVSEILHTNIDDAQRDAWNISEDCDSSKNHTSKGDVAMQRVDVMKIRYFIYTLITRTIFLRAVNTY